MATLIDIRELPDRFLEIVSQVAAGDEVIVTEGGTPRALLVPLHPPSPRIAGLHVGALHAAPDFDAPLPDDFWAGQRRRLGRDPAYGAPGGSAEDETMSESRLPTGWDAERVKRLIDCYERMSEDEQVAEDETAEAEALAGPRLNVQEIEQAISQLPPEDLATLRAWFVEFDAGVWDRQFEEDVAAGRLDARADEALESTYRQMASDKVREAEASEWVDCQTDHERRPPCP